MSRTETGAERKRSRPVYGRAFYQERKKPGISAGLDSGYVSDCLKCEWLKKERAGIEALPKVVYDIGVTLCIIIILQMVENSHK